MKKNILLLFITVCAIFISTNSVSAFTISDDGEYALIMDATSGTINGEKTKVIKFDFDEDEESIRLSDLTQGIKPTNDRNEFSGWSSNIKLDDDAKEMVTKNDFSNQVIDNESFEKGLCVYAKYDGEEIITYNVVLNFDGGKVNGENKILLTFNSKDFKTIDLSKYVPEKSGYTFYGWMYDFKITTSIDKSYFNKTENLTVVALYTKNTFEGNGYVLELDANGGTIDGEMSKMYDYTGIDSDVMPIIQYVPERKGYIFKGWNPKKEGFGKTQVYMMWEYWKSRYNEIDFEKSNYNDENSTYKNIKLYAIWEKNPNFDDEETIKDIKSSSKIDGSIHIEDGIDSSYKLEILPLDISESLKNKGIIALYDINIVKDQEIISINGIKMRISIKLSEDLLKYKNYKIVYLKNGEIKETLDAKIENGYIVFETSHLSNYAIVATKQEENNETKEEIKTEVTKETKTENPKTGDNLASYVLLSIISALGIISSLIIRKRFN